MNNQALTTFKEQQAEIARLTLGKIKKYSPLIKKYHDGRSYSLEINGIKIEASCQKDIRQNDIYDSNVTISGGEHWIMLEEFSSEVFLLMKACHGGENGEAIIKALNNL